ncbi:hypothetical protein [Cellulophaga sp. HaHa_2_1]|uniref:hypothetical protein n=1 Tax=Cellulophaga sp. HaHa_2_1 TaxID=2749994 RepID=UPI001C4FBCC1|nr:hypothetical protein [Cellulophaga sp. HaHa_2_1]QXP52548.1 hypothetical protein H0I24_01070 [Cellulophaga sp. HaHa_2_1]
MTKLIPIFIKILSYIALVYLLCYFIISIPLSLHFLAIIKEICVVNCIISLAIVLKLLLNTATFINYKVVEQAGWIKTFIVTAALDIIFFLIAFILSLPSFFQEFRQNNGFINEVEKNIKGLSNSDYSTLNPLQNDIMKSIILYITIALLLTLYFRFKYAKTIR